MVATVLLGFSMAALAEITGMSTLFASRFVNRTDAIDAGKNAISRISTDVRSARCFGDWYGLLDSTRDTSKYPSSSNPLYSLTSTPPNGWPSWETGAPFALGSRILIIQQPVLYLDQRNDFNNPNYISSFPQNSMNGFPIMFKPGDLTTNNPVIPAPSKNIENLDTVIYAVVPNPSNPSEYQLQMVRFPGAYITFPSSIAPSSYKQTINPPQVIVSGIIGPLPLGQSFPSPPEVFSYYQRLSNGGLQTIPGRSVNASNAQTIVGVKIDIELKKPNGGANTQVQYFGLHNEAFMRSNKNIVLRNTP